MARREPPTAIIPGGSRPAPEPPDTRRLLALFPVAATREADRLAVASGIPIARLMATAGARVAEAVLDRWPACRVEVLCGPGDNGGDGYVAALRLHMAGRPVSVRALGAPASAASRDAAERWVAAGGTTHPLAAEDADAVLTGLHRLVIVDALFGAGLSRPLGGAAAEIARKAGLARATVLSVDIASGVDGDTGRVEGEAFSAAATVAFERARPGTFPGGGRRADGNPHCQVDRHSGEDARCDRPTATHPAQPSGGLALSD